MDGDGRGEGEGRGLPASCFAQCGLCGNTLVVLGASVSMQIKCLLPKCLCVTCAVKRKTVCSLYI